MLQDLHIENIAVIEKADISFTSGLNVLTGETGAGKSIIIDALQSVMGARTNRELVRSGADKAVAAAVFVSDKADTWLKENDLEQEEEIVLQRRITEDGKTSCRISGVPVSAAQLREISSYLIDIHGQNDGRALMDESRHRDYLDSFGGYTEVLAAYSEAYAEYRATKKEISRLSMDELEKERLIDSLKSMVTELEGANLAEGEEEELTSRLELLRNSEKLTQSLESAYDALYGGEYNAVSMTENAAADADRASRYSGELLQVKKTLTDAGFMLRDAAETINDFLRGLDFSPEAFDRMESRLSQLKRLGKKYGGGEAELIAKLDDARNRLDETELSDETLRRLEDKLKRLTQGVIDSGRTLSGARKAAAKELEAQIVSELSELSMPSVRFEVDITPVNNDVGFDSTGADEIRFLMSANKGEKPGPISRIASGGELSRIMLAMKNVFSRRDDAETLVFDEIDTGVSGVAAQRVGEKLAELSRDRQVLCVTHLPQIAAMADTHFIIEKTEKSDRTYTAVTRLDRDGRKHELARLHGGENISETTLKSAEEQLEAAEKFKKTIGGEAYNYGR